MHILKYKDNHWENRNKRSKLQFNEKRWIKETQTNKKVNIRSKVKEWKIGSINKSKCIYHNNRTLLTNSMTDTNNWGKKINSMSFRRGSPKTQWQRKVEVKWLVEIKWYITLSRRNGLNAKSNSRVTENYIRRKGSIH